MTSPIFTPDALAGLRQINVGSLTATARIDRPLVTSSGGGANTGGRKWTTVLDPATNLAATDVPCRMAPLVTALESVQADETVNIARWIVVFDLDAPPIVEGYRLKVTGTDLLGVTWVRRVIVIGARFPRNFSAMRSYECHDIGPGMQAAPFIPPVMADGTFEVPGAAFLASGALGFDGAALFVDPGPEFAAAGSLLFFGPATFTQPGAAMSAAGTLSFSGDAAFVAPGAEMDAVGSQTFSGSMAATEPGAAFTAAGSLTFSGSLAAAQPGPAFAATGSQAFTGAFAATQPGPAFTAAALVVSYALSTITASPSTLVADGFSVSTITVQLKDPSGANVTVSAGTIALTVVHGTLSAVTDHANGTYTANYTAPASTDTSDTISGTLNGVALTLTAAMTLTFSPRYSVTSAAIKSWIDASQMALSNNASVTTLSDFSGLGNDCTQSTTAQKPVFKTGIQNALPVVRYDGSNDNHADPLSLAGVETVALVFALRVLPSSGNLGTVSNIQHVSTYSRFSVVNGIGSLQPYSWKCDIDPAISGVGVGIADAINTSAHVLLRTYTGGTNTSAGSYTANLDGTSKTVVTTSPTNYTSSATETGSVGAGVFSGVPANATALDLMERCVYNGVLSAGDQSALIAYLRAKWGI